ncbi:transposase [Bifidobacterium sp. ESL0763]|uniref:transposase n=1 Tax=Bifidobacterium sp. ESL0763 TaxID=2983227 RepID=UPI0035A868EC
MSGHRRPRPRPDAHRPRTAPQAHYQRCMVHFERNALSKLPRRRCKPVAAKLRAVFAMEDRGRVLVKVGKAVYLCEGICEATACQLSEFPMEH